MSRSSRTIRMLQAYVREGDEESYFRFVVDEKFIKYVTIAPDLYLPEDMYFEPALLPLLPAFPPGAWNVGHIGQDPKSNRPRFLWTAMEQLPAVQRVWHPMWVNYLDLKFSDKLRRGVFKVTSQYFLRSSSIDPVLFSTMDRPEDEQEEFEVVVKFARFPWEIKQIERETKIYQSIDGYPGLGPKFLGHCTENDGVDENRVIGFFTEYLGDNARFAGIEDLSACESVLARLHNLGFVHGDVERHNFVVGRNGQVTLVDFEFARRENDPSVFMKETESLRNNFADESGMGGVGTGYMD